jgi:AcrR family transcriptional regulator
LAQKRLKGPERRERLLDAAADIVIKQGVAAVTMEGVAQMTGVNKSIPYRYFTDRDDLLATLFDREHAIYAERWAELMPADAPFEQRVRGALQIWFLRADERGELFMRLISDSGRLAEKAKAVQTTNAEAWTASLQRHFELPPHIAKQYAWFMVAGTGGALAARNGDDSTLIETLTVAVAAGAEALRRRFAP